MRAPGVRRSAAVKGVSRRVVIVRSPDPEIFEEAIFFVRDDFLNSPGVSREELLLQARDAAGNYVQRNLGRAPRRIEPITWIRIAAILSALLAIGVIAYTILI